MKMVGDELQCAKRFWTAQRTIESNGLLFIRWAFEGFCR